VPVDVAALGVDLLTVVGHKMYAPKGIGALWLADGVPVEPLIGGGGQEHGLRAGTENVAHTVALGAASELCVADLAAGAPDRWRGLRDRLAGRLDAALPGRVRLNGHPDHRLPQTLNISIDGVVGEDVLAAVREVAASTGSACHAGRTEPSPVLSAMGMSDERALGALRLSLGRWTTPDDVDRAVAALAVMALAGRAIGAATARP
jgi:cysteine desulfurase